MDGLDYVHRGLFTSYLASIIYVILAGVFVINSILQLLAINNTERNVRRYYVMVVSSIFDKVGSNAYFLGALFAATAIANADTIWTFYTIGVCGFATGAAINMIVPVPNTLYHLANSLNLLGSLLYLSAIIITHVPLIQIIVISGDFIYVIDATLYIVCWFSDRRLAMAQGEQTVLLTK